MDDASDSLPQPDLGPRDRARRSQVLALSPRERLAAMQRLIDRSWAVLQGHATGLAHFRRRNFKARAIGRPGRGSPHGP
ncbi:MAG: hypothetical protein ACKOC4_01515 [Planctomycetia bacterium]